MMNYYGYGYNMMNWGGGFSVLCVLIGLVVLIDLVLVGVWLYKDIKKK